MDYSLQHMKESGNKIYIYYYDEDFDILHLCINNVKDYKKRKDYCVLIDINDEWYPFYYRDATITIFNNPAVKWKNIDVKEIKDYFQVFDASIIRHHHK